MAGNAPEKNQDYVKAWLSKLNEYLNKFKNDVVNYNSFQPVVGGRLVGKFSYVGNDFYAFYNLAISYPKYSMNNSQLDTFRNMLNEFKSSNDSILNKSLRYKWGYDIITEQYKIDGNHLNTLNNLINDTNNNKVVFLLATLGAFFCIQENQYYNLIKQPCVDKYIDAIIAKIKTLPALKSKDNSQDDLNKYIKTFDECSLLFDECFSATSFAYINEPIQTNRIYKFVTFYKNFVNENFNKDIKKDWKNNNYLNKYLRFAGKEVMGYGDPVEFSTYPFLSTKEPQKFYALNKEINFQDVDNWDKVNLLNPVKDTTGTPSVFLANKEYFIPELKQYANFLNDTDNKYQVIQFKDFNLISSKKIFITSYDSLTLDKKWFISFEPPRPFYGSEKKEVETLNILKDAPKPHCDASKFYAFDRDIFRPALKEQIQKIIDLGNSQKAGDLTPNLYDQKSLFKTERFKITNLPPVIPTLSVTSTIDLNTLNKNTPYDYRHWASPAYNEKDAQDLDKARTDANNKLKDLLINSLAKQKMGIFYKPFVCIQNFLNTQYPGWLDSLNYNSPQTYNAYSPYDESVFNYLISFYYVHTFKKSLTSGGIFAVNPDHGYIKMYMYYPQQVWETLT